MAFEALLSQEKLLAEIAKCEVVCACCHRIRTAARGGWYGDVLVNQ